MTDEELATLKARLPELGGTWRLEASARYIERLPESLTLTGDLQGEALYVASLIRDLARKLAA
jgi:hypothetical protein